MRRSQNQKNTLTTVAAEVVALEKQGRYEDALHILRPFWPEFESEPRVSGLLRGEASELLLRCGSIAGYLSRPKKIERGHEISKNLLTRARHGFADLGDLDKVSECEVYLASAYQRTGEIEEARSWVKNALAVSEPQNHWVHLYAFIIDGLLDQDEKKYKELIAKYKSVERLFAKYGDDFLKGCFHEHIGLALKNLGNLEESFPYLEKARDYFHKTKHSVYLASMENNLARVLFAQKKFPEAHLAAQRAREIFYDLGDTIRESAVLDTVAQIYLGEKEYKLALNAANEAIRLLKGSENSRFILDAHLTKVKALTRLYRFDEALLEFSDAIQAAKSCINEDAARMGAKEIGNALLELTPAFARKNYRMKNRKGGAADEEFHELILPAELPVVFEYFTVIVEDDSLVKYGMPENIYAVVGSQKIAEGDLIAFFEPDEEEISFGIYSQALRLISIEEEGDLEVFALENVKTLGKVVGYAAPPKKKGERLDVKAI